ncbi:MAG: DUF4203 domain-containing protein [Lachnospiraceae bacterium]
MMIELLELMQGYGYGEYFLAALLALGIVLCIGGYRIFKWAVGLLGFAISAVVCVGFMYYLFSPPYQVLLAVGICGGVLGAYFAASVYKLGVFLLSTGMAGFFVYSLTKEWTWTISIGLVVGIISVLLERAVLILTTATTGGFLLANLLATKAVLSDRNILLTGTALAVLGVVIQFLTTKKKAVKEENEMTDAKTPDTEPEDCEELHQEAEAETTMEEAAVTEEPDEEATRQPIPEEE